MTISYEIIINQVDYWNKDHSNVDEIHMKSVDKNESKSVYNDL